MCVCKEWKSKKGSYALHVAAAWTILVDGTSECEYHLLNRTPESNHLSTISSGCLPQVTTHNFKRTSMHRTMDYHESQLNFMDQIYNYYTLNGFPGTVDHARQHLDYLFGSKSWLTDNKKCIEYAMKILRAYPSLANEKFLLRWDSPPSSVSEWDACYYVRNSQLPPICHFFQAADPKDILTVLEISPDAVCSKQDGQIVDFKPLHVAFFRHPQEYKKQLSSLLEKYPAVFEGDNGSLLLDFLDGIMINHLRGDINLESIQQLADFIWHITIPEEKKILFPNGLICFALEYGYQPVLEYLVAKMPDSVWSKRMRINFDDYNIHMARGLGVLLPKLKSCCLFGDDDTYPSNDAFGINFTGQR
jgi:hypothetical protein